MKKLVWVGVAALLHFTLLPLSAQPQAPIEPAQRQVAPNIEAFDKQMLETQALIKKMNEQMQAISQSKNPQERNQLIQEHWLTMQSTMTAMHGMWGLGMMPCCRNGARYQRNNGMLGGPGMMDWDGMRPYYSRLNREQQKQHQYMMDQYMGLQQSMMDQMLKHQGWMLAPPNAVTPANAVKPN